MSLGSGARTSLTLDDVTAIEANVPEVAAAAPYSQTSAQVVAGGANWFTVIGGTTPAWLERGKLERRPGSLLHPG